jgi:protein-L-isoaspartate(D-aspartate) O-methyltransferase
VEMPDSGLMRRRRMVQEQIRARGVRDERVLSVMEEVPRELFVPSGEAGEAFSDKALPIDCQQTISQPFMVAAMTACLDVRPGHRILEVGTGSGYQTAILAKLAGSVFTVERWPLLLELARQRLTSMDLRNVAYRVGDGTAGWPEEAPFDRIMVTAGAPEVPPVLVEELVNGGLLVIPVGDQSDQIRTVIERRPGRNIERPQFACRFVKLVGEHGWSDTSPRS